MKTIAIPVSLALDRTASSVLIHLAVVLATLADNDAFVRESQKGLATRLSCEQETVVVALRELRERGLIAVSQDEHGYLYRIAWITPRSIAPAAKAKRFAWVQIKRPQDKNPSWLRLENPPQDRDMIVAYVEGRGDTFIRLKSEPPKLS